MSNGKLMLDKCFTVEDALVDFRNSEEPSIKGIKEILDGLSHTNVAPSSDDSNAVARFRLEASIELKSLHDERRTLQESVIKSCIRIAEIRCVTATRERYLQVSNRVLSPFRRLPPEILEQIFYYAREFRPSERQPGKPLPLIIGQVCHSWRQISITRSLLWDTVDMTYIPSPFYSLLDSSIISTPTTAILDLCFQRSYPLPLNLSLRPKFLSSDGNEIPPIHISSVKTIASICHRIQKLGIHANSKSTVEPLLLSSIIQFPMLESLHLEMGRCNDGASGPVTLFERCTALREVVLDLQPTHPFRIIIPWGQITHLDMLHGNRPIADSTWRTLVRMLRNLENGRFCLAGRVPGTDDPFLSHHHSTVDLMNTFELSHLHTLTIRFVGQELPQNRNIWLLKNLDFPNLQDFHFSFVRASTLPSFFFWRNENLQNPLYPLLHKLKSLTLWAISISTTELIDLLKLTTSLERFRFKGAAKWTLRYLVRSLTLKTGECFTLAPSLKNVIIWAENVSKSEAQSYMSMITTRQERRSFKMTIFCRKRLKNVPDGYMVVVEDLAGAEFLDL
ncbi:hypothetical protein CVT25_006136 [Psilocybe cyanescens]|uniref:Uncharacterized protein n=1 Tax=Psilocybe cyanescens TaxID=93625 RepID=A0A409WZ35_PSICY|nr:hypothetical protein CVT25_006136 [Psilocybe cyanescens]